MSQMPPSDAGWGQPPAGGPQWGQPAPTPGPGWGPPPGPGGPPPGPGGPPPGPGFPAQPGPGGPYPAQPGPGGPYPGMPGPPSGRKGNGPLIAVVMVLVVAAVGAGAFFLLSGDDDEGSGPEGVTRSYYDAVKDRDCDAMVELVDLGGESREDLVAECRQLFESDALGDEVTAMLPAELVSIDTVSETESDATLTVEYRTQGGSTESSEVVLVNDGSGWLISAENSFGAGSSGELAPPDGELTPPEGDIDLPDDSDDSGSGGSDAGSDDPELSDLSDACGAGDMAACDDLWLDTDVGSDLEAFAETCGGRDSAGGHYGDCEATFG